MSIEDAGISRRLSGNHLYALTSQLRSASIDVARHLGYSKPSVSVAMKRLRENGYVNMDDNNLLTLTESGLAIARSIFERHQVISGYLMSIGVSEETALKDACRIEHVLSEETFHKIKEIFYQSRK